MFPYPSVLHSSRRSDDFDLLFHCLPKKRIGKTWARKAGLSSEISWEGNRVWTVLFWKHPRMTLHPDVTSAEPSVRQHKSPASPNAAWPANVTALALSTGHMQMSHVIEYVKFPNTGFRPFWVCLRSGDDRHDPCLHQAFSLHQGRQLGVCSLLEMSYREGYISRRISISIQFNNF